MNLGNGLRQPLRRLRRSLWEMAGSARYSRMGLHDLDRKLERYLGFNGGTFVEAGANDGVEQSNSYYLERFRQWNGLLVEPVPALAAACRRHRRSVVMEAALVAADDPRSTVELHFAGLMSTVDGALGDAEMTARHVQAGLAVQGLAETFRVVVRACTISALLDEARMHDPVDLLSLDVEGGEPEALRGIDFARHAPRYICVEARDRAAIDDILLPRYALAEVLTDLGTHCDLLYARR